MLRQRFRESALNVLHSFLVSGHPCIDSCNDHCFTLLLSRLEKVKGVLDLRRRDDEQKAFIVRNELTSAVELEERQLVNEHCWVPEVMSASSHEVSISELKSLMLTQESIKSKKQKTKKKTKITTIFGESMCACLKKPL